MNSLPGGGTESPGGTFLLLPISVLGLTGQRQKPTWARLPKPRTHSVLVPASEEVGVQQVFCSDELWTPHRQVCNPALPSSLSQHFSFLSQTMIFLGDAQPRWGCSVWLKEGSPNCPQHWRGSGEPHPVPALAPQGTIVRRVPTSVHSTFWHWVQVGCVG